MVQRGHVNTALMSYREVQDNINILVDYCMCLTIMLLIVDAMHTINYERQVHDKIDITAA